MANPYTFIGTISKIVDPENPNRFSEFDPLASHLIIQSHEHHEIHEGSTYNHYFSEILGVSGLIQFYIKTPSASVPQKRIHLISDFTASGPGSYNIIENLDYVTGGTATSGNNRNRDSVKISNLQQFYTGSTGTSTITTSGASSATLVSQMFGSFQSGGGVRRDQQEWVLKPDTGYLFKLMSTAATNSCFLVIDWYELTDK